MLVVDDNETNRKIVHLQGELWGMEVVEAASGQEALAYFEQGEPFDVAILDMGMPDMDGLTLAEQIRRYQNREALPLIMLTSFGLREFDRRLAYFAAFLTKPIKASALFEAIIGVLAPGGAPEPFVRSFESQSGSPVFNTEMARQLPLKILLAEDNDLNRKMTLLMLDRLGYQADVAVNGQEVLGAVEERPYDVILMDIQMPVMDGVEAARRIRHRSDEQRPIIVALTADVVESARERYLVAGMDDYISKPVTVADLVLSLRRAAELRAEFRRGERPAEMPTVMTTEKTMETDGAAEAPPEAATGKQPQLLDKPVFDPAGVNWMNLSGEAERAEMLPLVVEYHQDAQRLLGEMEAALGDGDLEAMARAAHILMSSSAYFGMAALSAVARQIEALIKDGQPENLDRLMAQAKAAYEDGRTALSAYLEGQS
jgi:CheY-like chemotaxis protein/HPt (histidine-containing phosphotransfer) domain-containing protein